MRIIYDDARQQEVVKLVVDCLVFLNSHMDRVTRYEWGMDRVQRAKVKERLNGYLEDYGFEIGNTVTHANGIGNNCMYPVYYLDYPETQHCANININSGMYGEVYVSIEDYNGRRVSKSYKLTRNGVTVGR